jgi:hypothetical protein
LTNIRGVLKGHFDHGMAGQGAVQVVELIATGGPDGEGDAEVISRFARPHFDGGWVKARVKLRGQFRHGFGKAIHACAHDFDGKVAGVFNQ